MKKIVFLLIIGWMSVSAGYAQLPVKFYDENCAISKNILETLEFQNDSIRTQLSAGFYGGDQIISLGSSTMLELRFEGDGPIDFSYDDGAFVYIEQGVQTSPYYFEVRPMNTTTYHLRKVRNASGFGYIQQGHEYVTVNVGSGNVVTTQFDLPASTCPYSDPINLRDRFTTNVTGGVISFRGDGVDGEIFYPSKVSSGSHAITAKLTYNGQEYPTTRYIYVYESVTLWLPEILPVGAPPLVLSGGHPSGGSYYSPTAPQAVVGNMFYPNLAGVGQHEILYTYNGMCGGVATARIKVISGTGVEENGENVEFSVYPNPTKGIINFSTPCTVKIISSMGVVVRVESSMRESLDISDLPSGVYDFLIYTEDGNILARKVLKH